MADDPFDRLECVAERVADRAERTTARVYYEQGNRLGLLWIHALVAITAGLQQLLWGTATQIEELFGPRAREFHGPLAMVGGMVLVLGLTRKPYRSVRLEAIGLSLIALWDGTMTAGLAWARIHQDDYRVIPFGQPLPPHYASAYPISVYSGLLALLVVHLWTLRRFRKHGFNGARR